MKTTKCKIYANGVHYLTVDEDNVDNMVKWLKDTGHINIKTTKGISPQGENLKRIV